MVSGPAASGKSRWAEHLSQSSGRPVVVLATGPELPDDPSWQARLARHRQRRPPTWRTIEVGGNLAHALHEMREGELALVDSLGTWVAAHLNQSMPQWQHEVMALLQSVRKSTCSLVIVSEETGWGVVPATKGGGRFRDRLGELQQQLTPLCDAAWLVIHGRAIDLEKLGEVVPVLEA